MLRVEFEHDGNGRLDVRLQGRLVGAYAEDARIAVARFQLPASLMVDLSEVTFIDSLGEEVLSWLGRLGATFIAANVYTRAICERLELHVSEKRTDSTSRTDSKVLA